MQQIALKYDPAHAGSDTWIEVLGWLKRAVDCLGHKEVAYRLDVAPSQLTDALCERERKDVKAKWLWTVLHMCQETPGRESLVRDFMELTGARYGYEVERKKTRTPEEELREMRELLRREAPGVLALVDKELGR